MRHGIVVSPCYFGMRLNRQDKWFKEILGAGNGYAGEKSRFLCRYAAIAGRSGGSAARDTQDAPKGEGEEHAIQTYVRFSHKTSFQRHDDTSSSIRCP